MSEPEKEKVSSWLQKLRDWWSPTDDQEKYEEEHPEKFVMWGDPVNGVKIHKSWEAYFDRLAASDPRMLDMSNWVEVKTYETTHNRMDRRARRYKFPFPEPPVDANLEHAARTSEYIWLGLRILAEKDHRALDEESWVEGAAGKFEFLPDLELK